MSACAPAPRSGSSSRRRQPIKAPCRTRTAEQGRGEQQNETIVAFIFTKVASCGISVSPPNTRTITAVTSGMTGTMLRHHVGHGERHRRRDHQHRRAGRYRSANRRRKTGPKVHFQRQASIPAQSFFCGRAFTSSLMRSPAPASDGAGEIARLERFRSSALSPTPMK